MDTITIKCLRSSLNSRTLTQNSSNGNEKIGKRKTKQFPLKLMRSAKEKISKDQQNIFN